MNSTDVTDRPFGYGANGSQSGYDFVTREYYNSYDASTGGAYTNGEEQNLDMVEHNGPFGTNGTQWSLGFTSGISTIWNSEIKGNGITKWHHVSNGATAYGNLLSYTDLKNYYDSTKATVDIGFVQKDEVYIGRIRNTDLYVMIKCTNVLLPKGAPNGDDDNLYFEFDYKFGTSTGVTGVGDTRFISTDIYPNPASEYIILQTPVSNIESIQVSDITGKQYELSPFANNTYNNGVKIDLQPLPHGIYTLIIFGQSGRKHYYRLVKTD